MGMRKFVYGLMCAALAAGIGFGGRGEAAVDESGASPKTPPAQADVPNTPAAPGPLPASPAVQPAPEPEKVAANQRKTSRKAQSAETDLPPPPSQTDWQAPGHSRAAEPAVYPPAPAETGAAERRATGRQKNEARPKTTITLPPKKEAVPADRPTRDRSAAPAPVYSPAPAETGAAERRPVGGRKDARPKTTITLPSKPQPAQAEWRTRGRSDMPAQGYPPASTETGAVERRPIGGRTEDRAKTTITLPSKPQPARAGRAERSLAAAEPAMAAPPQAYAAPPAPEPARGGRKNKREAQAPMPMPMPAPVAAPMPGAPLTEEAMIRAYQAFDYNYQSSLGKTRKELADLWGFPMQKMGDNGTEVAYGFRQRGLLNLPEPKAGRGSGKAKNATYYASNNLDPSLPGKHFSCLVVLWIDKGGRGVVVDGDAVGDCFMVESLPQKPDHFER